MRCNMRFVTAVFTVLAISLPAWGQSVTLPAEVRGAPGSWIIIAPEKVDGGAVKWRIDPGLQEVRLDLLLPPEMLVKLKGKVVTGLPGRYKVEAWNAKGDVASDIATCWVTITGSVPPGPGPGPLPPPPIPDPPKPDPPKPDPVTPAPIPAPGFRVLFMFEDTPEGRNKLSPGQRWAILGGELRDWLDAKCVVSANGKTREYNIWDSKVDVSNAPKLWQDAMALSLRTYKGDLPFMVISNGRTGVVRAMPKDQAEIWSILKQYAGE